MLSRPKHKPIFLGLSTAAIFAAGALVPVPAAAAPAFELTITVPDSLEAGGSADATVKVAAAKGETLKGVKVTVEIDEPARLSWRTCPGTVTVPVCEFAAELGEEGEELATVLGAPKTMADDTEVALRVKAEAADDVIRNESQSITLKAPPDSPDPTTPPPTTSKPPTKKPSSGGKLDKGGNSDKDTDTDTGGDSGTGGSSGSSGSTGGGTVSSGSSPIPPSGIGDTTVAPPSPDSSQVALPPVSSPAVAPATGNPPSVLRSGSAATPQELSFERLASTQAAWLAALMVAFSLLLTQVRMGRKRVPVVIRTKGLHRRPRRGLFGR